jgi:hypothetical protein
MRSYRLSGALLAAAVIAIACTACSGNSDKPGRVSIATALRQPCLLVTQAEVQSILGHQGKLETESDIKSNSCDIADRGMNIFVQVETQPFDPLVAEATIRNTASVAGLGHRALCGGSLLNAEPFSIKTYDLDGAIDSHHSLNVAQGPSCAVDARLASAVYSHI